jgi:uncharacterized iron-regulated protein
MLEADNQKTSKINIYQVKLIKKKLDSTARYIPNYKTDYKTVSRFCKENKSQFIATNTPRRLASMVSKKGFPAENNLKKNRG